MAIPVLMTQDFQLPRDYYYWGQNRLGSLLPMVSYWINTLIKVHPIYIISIVHYLFLFIPFVIISRLISGYWLRLALLGIIFLPMNSYSALLLIGHPYSQQLFCGTLFIVFFIKAVNRIGKRGQEEFLIRESLISIAWLSLSILFFIAGVWVSEFNAILALFPLMYILREGRKYSVTRNLKSVSAIVISGVGILYLGFRWFMYTKQVAVQDPSYSNAFFFDRAGISKEFHFMLNWISTSFDFTDKEMIFQNTLYVFLIGVILLLVWKYRRVKSSSTFIPGVLVVISTVSIIILFLSTWNLRSEYCTRYYTPVYLMLAFAILLYLNNLSGRFIKPVVCMLVLFHCYMYEYKMIIRNQGTSPFVEYADFSALPSGTLIADYSDTYLISAVAIHNLKGITFDNELVRNYNWRDSILATPNIYFLNNELSKRHGLKDTIRQFGRTYVFTGKKYSLKAEEVLLYKKQ